MCINNRYHFCEIRIQADNSKADSRTVTFSTVNGDSIQYDKEMDWEDERIEYVSLLNSYIVGCDNLLPIRFIFI